MKRWGTALVALVLGVAAPLAAHAADYDRGQLDRGMKDAPAIVQKAGVPCTVTAAADIGSTDGKDGKAEAYEVACQQGLGYVLLSGKTVKAYDCLATESQPSLKCKLPANANPVAGMSTFIAAAKVTCTPTKARYVGANATTSVYEVACQEGPGYIIQTPAIGAPAAPVQAIPCMETEGKGPMECTLTTKAQSQAALAALVAKTGKSCQVSNDRFIGTDSKTHDSYVEIACGTQPGFVLAETAAGGVDRVIPCTQAQGLGGGCTLTDMTAANAQLMADYGRRLAAAGYNCNVDKFRDIGSDSAHNDIVEVACSNRPDGAVVSFPASPAGKLRISDCVSSAVYGEAAACTLSSKSAVYARYNAALTAKGRGECVVNDARYIGSLGNGDSYVETACTDGKPGWVVDFTPQGVAKDVLTCGQAKEAGIGCQIPANIRGGAK